MWDELNWNYIADGSVLPTHDIHNPQGRRDLQSFTNRLINNHMKYLTDLGYMPRNPHCSHICFSYEPTYESVIRCSEIWHAKKLNPDEITLFEKSVLNSHDKFWDRQ